MKRRSLKKCHGESGFAMLLVFVMAAAIAITLYIEVPRIAFESQRTREQMAIDRGLQYERAIQLFYRKYRTYPQTLDDLETIAQHTIPAPSLPGSIDRQRLAFAACRAGRTTHRFADPACGSASGQQYRQRSECARLVADFQLFTDRQRFFTDRQLIAELEFVI